MLLNVFKPNHVFIEDDVKDTEYTRRILNKLPESTIREIFSNEKIDQPLPQKSLLLARQRGPFLRHCPGTPKHICCMYYNLDIAAGCDLNCSYCILQGYLNVPTVTFYCNIEDMINELDRTLSMNQQKFFRIGTGELTDSLTFDHLTSLSADLVHYFSNKQNAVLELKSKNVNIENFLHLPHNKRTVVSWSVNSDFVIQKEEPLAPLLEERLSAAKEVQNAGFWLGFHFDPMIYYHGWQEGYKKTIDKIFSVVKPENIAWISLGALRYPPWLDEIIRKNHPSSDIVLGELLPGSDQKHRYFKSIRIEMFRKMYNWIQAYSQDVFVYLCMESDEVWRKSFGWSPGSSAKLKTLLDDRMK